MGLVTTNFVLDETYTGLRSKIQHSAILRFTDCTSFAVMRQLDITSAFAFGDHFESLVSLEFLSKVITRRAFPLLPRPPQTFPT